MNRREERRLKRKKMRVTFITLLLVVIILLAFQAVKPLIIQAQEPLQVVTVVVKKGDSLWKIAERYDNNKIDIRRYITIIKTYNHLDNATLQPSQRLQVPIFD